MKTFFKVMCLLVAVTLSAGAKATLIDAYGAISYNRVGNVVNIKVATIENIDLFTTSGTLHVRLSATTTPSFNSSAYLLADVNLSYINGTGQLAPGLFFYSIDVDTAFTPPPNGTYYIHLYVSEFPNLSTALDYHTFSSTETFGPVIVFPNAPSNLNTLTTTDSTVGLSWQDNSLVETGFTIERSTSSSSGYVFAGSVGPNITTYTVTGLASSTTYFFRVKAYNSSGDSSYSNVVNSTTLASISTPQSPSGLNKLTTTESSVELSWQDNSNVEMGFHIERSTSSGSGYLVIASVDPNVTTYTATGLESSTTYYFRVKAYNRSGDSSYSNVVSGTTLTSTSSPAPSTGSSTSTTKTGGGGGGGGLNLWLMLTALMCMLAIRNYYRIYSGSFK